MPILESENFSYRLKAANKEQPRAVIGMTDISVRPCIDAALLSFSVPYIMFQEMEDNFASGGCYNSAGILCSSEPFFRRWIYVKRQME